MCDLALDRILTGAAIALLFVTAGIAQTAPRTAAIEAAIPIPEPANVPPPTVGDIGLPAPVAVPPLAAAAKSTAPPVAVAPPGAAPVSANDTNVQSTILEADRPIADKIKELIERKLTTFFERRQEHDGVQAFYAERSFAPLWIENGMASARAKAAIAFLAAVDEDGLDSTDYPPLELTAGAGPAELAAAELKFTDVVLNFARHAQNGRVHFSRVSGSILYELEPPDSGSVLNQMAIATNVSEVLAAYYPPHAGYRALKAKLAEMRDRTREPELVPIPDGKILRPGMEDPRVPLLRRRLKIDSDEANISYDGAVFEAVKRVQEAAGLPPDGMLGPVTLRALNESASRTNQIDVIIANMERWRWLPRDLGKVYSMLNIPDFTLKVVNNGVEIWSTRVVVGKASTPTPLLSETMKYITVNPTWNVPPSIVQNEYLPALQQDPTALSRMGIRVVQNRDGSIRMYQPPGERNALGRLRFNFPNRFLVYQHDTPDKNLFDRKRRAYSHGCMRVQDPETYAEILLSVAAPNNGYTAERLRKMFGGPERQINFATPIPVHITYQTAFVDKSGTLQRRNDLYGLDARTLAALRGKDRLIADVAVVRREKVVTRRPVRLPPGVAENEGGWSFFERLFR